MHELVAVNDHLFVFYVVSGGGIIRDLLLLILQLLLSISADFLAIILHHDFRLLWLAILFLGWIGRIGNAAMGPAHDLHQRWSLLVQLLPLIKSLEVLYFDLGGEPSGRYWPASTCSSQRLLLLLL